MADIPAQKLTKLIFPMLIAALLTGAVLGALGGGFLVLPDLIDSSGDPGIMEGSIELDAYNGWGRTAGYFLIPIAYGTVGGMLMALISGAGSYAVMAIQEKRQPSLSENDQVVAGGVGAAVAGILPAMFAVLVIGMGGVAGVALGTALMVLCFVIALLLLRGILRIVGKRDASFSKRAGG